ncbi:MAG: glycosyltransferase [Nitrosopumilus sp.]|nr:glycosyltransferase [Nitrosopumilus sp.]
MNSKSLSRGKLTIGLPVYNGEKFLHKCLDSLLEQSFENFEIIISDNASTDKTQNICQEYSEKDKRIRYIRQEKNIGLLPNFNFVLDQSNNEFFMWMGVDDYILPDYVKKNMDVLASNSNVVGSVSKIKPYNFSDSPTNQIDSKFIDFTKKLRTRFKKLDAFSISGNYDQKVRNYLTGSTCQVIYGIFRTDKLQKSIIPSLFVGLDWAEMLNVLKFGDIHVINEVLMYEFEGGRSSGGILHISKTYNPNVFSIIFPWFPFTNTCLKILGVKLFLKNLDYFIKLNFEGFVSQIIDLTRLLFQKLNK